MLDPSIKVCYQKEHSDIFVLIQVVEVLQLSILETTSSYLNKEKLKFFSKTLILFQKNNKPNDK
jgi:hypothetical protein